MTRQGTPHFRRKRIAPNIELTDDDKSVFLDLYRHGIMDSNTIRRTLPHRSSERVGKRLRGLMDAGFINKPRQQKGIYVHGGGSRAQAYTLGNKAARYLQEELCLPVRIDRWKTTSDELSTSHIHHTLAQTKFMIDLRMSVAMRNAEMGFEYPDEIYRRIKPELLTKARLPLAFKTRVEWHGWRDSETTVPDGFCALRYLHAPLEKSSRYLFIEIDRGTETIEPSIRNLKGRSFFRGNSLLRKFVVYGNAYRRGAHTETFGIPTFQVLTVTTTADRARQMMATYQKHLAIEPHNMPPIRFLFTDFEALVKHENDVLAVPIYDGKGKQRSLLG